jgi:type III secretion protein P
MNRVMSLQGTTTAPDGPPMAQANQVQQQRFEQAMHLDQEQKTARHHVADELYRLRDQLHRNQQSLRKHKSDAQENIDADSTLQQDIPTSQASQQSLLNPASIQENGSNAQHTTPSGWFTHNSLDKKDQTAQHAFDLDKEHINLDLFAAGPLQLSAKERVQPASLPLALDTPRSSTPSTTQGMHDAADNMAPHTMIDALVPDMVPTASNLAQPEDNTSLTDSDVGPLLATESEETRLADEELGTNGQPFTPLVRTPGDLLLARISPTLMNHELGQLLERLAVDIQLELGRPERPPLLRLNLPELGELAIRIAHHHGELQIEILATSQGQLLLNQGRSELIDRLQRLYPGEQVTLDLFNQADSEQGSRQQRSIYEEWDADA